MRKTICELFAGVGGFRVGFEALKSGWKTVWFSQWEPGKAKQDAHDCYVRHFGDIPNADGRSFTNVDIAQVDESTIPRHTLLVGGFPCQDYSVAHTLASAKGIEGKKGVLWWEINRILNAKKPKFCIFENVDRLLKSPASQRGRDFGMILACLNELGYTVEWRVVNAAQYGAAQRRRRVFIFAAHEKTKQSKRLAKLDAPTILKEAGLMAQAFPISALDAEGETELAGTIGSISASFAFQFEAGGVMRKGKIYTANVTPKEEAPIPLGKILEKKVDEKYFLSEEKLDKFRYLKGAKKLQRTARNGHVYAFSEGPIAYPDPWDRPSRTMLTSESTLNRSTHVVKDKTTGRLRILTPVEAEKLQGFPANWTEGMPDRMRYFCMGNALVTTMITRMGKVLDGIIEQE